MTDKIAPIYKELGEVAEIVLGQSPPSSTYNTDGKGLPFFQGKAEFTDLHPRVRQWCISPTKIANEGDILLSVRAPIGPTNIADQKCGIGRGLAAVRYRNSRYIYYFLKSIEQKLDSCGTGTTFRAITGSVIRSLQVPTFPAEYEERLTLKIEELLGELDSSANELHMAQQKTEAHRKALLSQLFKRAMKHVPLGTVLTDVRYGTAQKCEYNPTLTPVLRIPNVANGSIDKTDLKHASFTEKEQNRLSLTEGDILIIRSNGSVSLVGSSAVVTAEEEGYLFAGYLIRLRMDKDSHFPLFYHYALQSPYVRQQIESKAKSTSGVNNINSDEIRSLMVPEFSYQEQVRIAEEISTTLVASRQLLASIDQALLQEHMLRHQVLRQAFTGKLSPAA